MKAGTCARGRRALNVHVKHSDLTSGFRHARISPNDTWVKSSANGLVGTGFASWYRLQPRAGF